MCILFVMKYDLLTTRICSSAVANPGKLLNKNIHNRRPSYPGASVMDIQTKLNSPNFASVSGFD